MSPLWDDLLTALALVLILEGLIPTVAPRAWIKAVIEAARMGPVGVRRVGMVCMLSGAMLLYWFL